MAKSGVIFEKPEPVAKPKKPVVPTTPIATKPVTGYGGPATAAQTATSAKAAGVKLPVNQTMQNTVTQPTPVTPAPGLAPGLPTTPAAPTGPDTAGAEAGYWDNLAKGQTYADEHFKTGTLGTMTDPRQAEMNAQLARLQAGQNGMTPEEMQAAREQGRTEIDRQLASNMRRLGGAAAANGVRGASGVGLQARATTEAQNASGDLGRKLVLDNLNQRNIGTAAYTGALTGQQGVELGIQDKNIGLRNQEAFGRASIPFQIAGGLDAAKAGARSDWMGEQQIGVAKDAIKSASEAEKNNPNKINATGPLAGKTDAEKLKAFEQDPHFAGLSNKQKTALLNQVDNQFAQERGYSSWAAMPPELQNSPEGKEARETARTNFMGGGSDQFDSRATTGWGKEAAAKGEQQKGCPVGTYCFVMTAARDSGLLSQQLYKDTTDNCPTKSKYAAAYGVWGLAMANVMRRSPTFARAIAYLVPDTLKVIKGQPSTVKGYLAYYGLYVPLSYVSNAYLFLKGK